MKDDHPQLDQPMEASLISKENYNEEQKSRPFVLK
jgi:hypothetical protein